jgi:hypothetical protein
MMTAVMRVMIAAMGFALMGVAVGLYAHGFGLQGFLTLFWLVLGTAGLLLAVLFLRSLKLSADERASLHG